MSAMAVPIHSPALLLNPPRLQFRNRWFQRHSISIGCDVPRRAYSGEVGLANMYNCFKSSVSGIRSSQSEDAEAYDASRPRNTTGGQDMAADQLFGNQGSGTAATGGSFLAKLAIAIGIAATITLISVGLKRIMHGSSNGFHFLPDDSSASILAAPSTGFTFKVLGYTVVLPEYAPGWVYFWLLMAAGFGLFISEEALNIWVGISFARMLSFDGTWQSFGKSFSRNAAYIISTFLWVYWGVCISDMVHFYLGKLFRKAGGSDDVCSKLGIGKERATDIVRIVQKYGNLIGFVERFSLGLRNPIAFLAGALDISSHCFFAGVCGGGLITVTLQLGIGFLFRERPVVALATVATVVGIVTVFPYVIAASTALVLYLRRRFSS
ncbi:hypothetical protein NMG60_11014223 [Bertholletia excelsa]